MTDHHRVEVLLLWDIASSTRMLVELGMDRYRLAVRTLKESLVDVLTDHGGDSFKDTGDGGWAAFDSAQDAIDAAVELQRTASRASESLGATDAIPIRVVLTAGDVWVNPNSDRSGLAINTAVRVEERTPPKEIRCTSVVAALAAGWGGHQADHVSTERFRDIPGPVEIFRIPWQRSPIGERIGLPAPLDTEPAYRFVGRRQHLDRLASLWADLPSTGVKLVSVAGEAGVGKSRLCAEFARQIRSNGGVVLYGQCDEFTGYAYEPFVQALESYVDAAADRARDLGRHAVELSRIVPSIRDRIEGLGEPPQLDPDLARHRLFEAISAWLGHIASEAPTLVILDDFTWATEATARLSRHLASALADHPVLLLVTYRPEETSPAARAITEQLIGVEHIELQGFDDDEMARFAAEVAGGGLDPVGVAAAQRLGEEAGGNPFMVAELLKAVLEADGSLSVSSGATLHQRYSSSSGIPFAVRAIVRRRVSRLSPQAQHLVRLAAVAGERFDPKVIERLLGSAGFHELTSEAERAGIIRYRRESGEFTHSIIRRAVLAEESDFERERDHQQIGEAIEEVHQGRLDRHFESLAYQFSQCSGHEEREKAISYCRLAATAAIDRLDHDQAVAHHRLALRVRLRTHQWPRTDTSQPALPVGTGDAAAPGLERQLRSDRRLRQRVLAAMVDDDQALHEFLRLVGRVVTLRNDFLACVAALNIAERLQVCEHMVELGRSLKWAGRSESRAVLRMAARQALSLQSSDVRGAAADLCATALLADTRGIFTWAGVTDTERVELLEQSLVLPISPLKATLLRANLGAELPFSSSSDRPLELSSGALDTARALEADDEESRATVARVMNLHIGCLWRPDKIDERLQLCPELLERCRDLNRPSLSIQAATSYFQAAMEAGDFERIPSLLATIERTATELRQPLTVGYAKLRQANWAAVQGRLEESNRLATEAAQLATEAGQPDAEAFLAGQLFIIQLHRGALRGVAPMIEPMTEQYPSIGAFRSALAMAWVEAEDEAKVRSTFAVVMDQLSSVSFDLNWLLAMALACYPCWYLADHEAADVLLAKLAPFHNRYVDIASGFYGSVNHYRALLFDARGDWNAADECFAAAVSAHAAIPSPPWQARTLLDWGMSLQRRSPLETGQAIDKLRRAGAVATDAGLAGLAVRIDRVYRLLADPVNRTR